MQRGERIWVPWCGVGLPSRLECCRSALQPYDSSARLNTTVLYHSIASSLAPAVTRCAMTETDGGN